MRFFHKYLPIRFLTVLVLMCATTSGIAQDHTPQNEVSESTQVRSVHWLKVQLQSTQGVSLAGIIEPRVQTKMGFRVLGRLVSREVSIGEHVQIDQTLAIVDPTSFEINVRAVRSVVSNAQAQFDNAIINEERVRALLATNVATVANLEAAVQNLQGARAALTSAKISLDKAEEQLSYTRIIAEHEGVVTETFAAVGETVAPGQTVLIVASLDQREAVVAVPDTIVDTLTVGSAVVVTLEADPSIMLNGVVREIAPEADSLSRTVRARISLEGDTSAFRLGTTVTVISVSSALPAIYLPLSAILDVENAPYVWVISTLENSASLQPVNLGETLLGKVTVLNGLEPGETIVAVGVNSLHEGQDIRLGKEVRN